MKHRYFGFVISGLTALTLMASHSLANADSPPTGLVAQVLEGTERFRDPQLAEAEGWANTGSCVSGPERGAMGIHLVNRPLLEDAELDPQRPESLVYEERNGRLRLVAVEFIVIAETWHEENMGPPVLLGQHFHYVGAPNRNGLPAFYELHVWAFKNNPNGMVVDWNPRVSCEEFDASAP